MKVREYTASFDCGNDIVDIKILAISLEAAKRLAKKLKKSDFENDRRIKVTVRWKI